MERENDPCSDRRPLSELDPVTFFIVTELMIAERATQTPQPRSERMEPIEEVLSQVA
jgi:hypothetical protein